jgi:hypothetical protein
METSAPEEATVLGEVQLGKRGDCLVVGGGADPNESLQARFLRFQQQRKREKKLQRGLANAGASGRERDTEQLRERFIAACKAYIGVPYSAKGSGATPEDEDYGAPLFLDCCALIRRAVQDLQEDFGFAIGRWNQAYQFETLPDELTFEQLVPGDLIFVEGIYHEANRKPQRRSLTR